MIFHCGGCCRTDSGKSHGSGGAGICHRSYEGGSRSVDPLEKRSGNVAAGSVG